MATDGRGGRTIIIIVAVIALLAVIAYAIGLFNVDTSGDLKTPDVDVAVEGGEVPDVQVETGRVDVGTETEKIKVPDVDVDVKTDEAQIEVPTVDVQPAGDDGSTKK